MASSARSGGGRTAGSSAERRNGQQHGRVVSHAPGRMRVRLDPEHRDAAAMAQVERELGGRSGVASVATDHRTGSVLVHYEDTALSRDDVLDMLYDVGVVARDLLGADAVPEDLGVERADRSVAPHSSGATSILDAVTDLDHRISRLTGGKLDLKLLVPAGLGLLALRQVAVNGLGLGTVPGYVLLWYTFDSFYKLHQRKATAAIREAPEELLGDGSDSGADDGARRSTGERRPASR